VLYTNPGVGSGFIQLGHNGNYVAEIQGDPSGNFLVNANGIASGVLQVMRTGAVANTMVLKGGSVGIGTTNPVHPLHVAGAIGAEEVIVSSTGADYVFEPDYRLRPLKEVAAYIEANHHLPDIPSADEVKEKGMGVGEMEAKLLAKIEELTLHMIHEHKRNDRLEEENRQLRDAVRRINERIGQ
jgi:hypothetical protein